MESAGYWNDPSAWKYYGDMENNFSTIGNQQRSPAAALVEKLINSVDAVLIKECISRGISPQSTKAPQSIQQALKEFFIIREGKLSNVEIYERGLLEKMESVPIIYYCPYYLLLFRVVAYKSLFDDKPYAYGDYINGKLVNFEIY